MTPIKDHPLRYALTNEIHARPFVAVKAPSRAVYVAIKRAEDVPGRDRAQDLAHLTALLDRHGVAHPQPGATHYSGVLGPHYLKWEQHTEFVTYTMFLNGLGERPFDANDFAVFPPDWLAEAPGVVMTSAMLRVCLRPDDDQIEATLDEWFTSESLAVSRVIEDEAIVAGDFRIDPSGHLRFAVFVQPQVGQRRVGRVAQRLFEIETYKTMSMLGHARVQAMSTRLNEIDTELTRLVTGMADGNEEEEQRLSALLSASAELESLTAQSAFRFAATKAYQALVSQRVSVLRETRFHGRQNFSEFMMRRYDPAMRTVQATDDRLAAMSQRASRASDLLRTRVEVMRSALNQQLLESMNRRSEMQLQLQKTVEGLSVVAISYYAVSLAAYLTAPLAGMLGLSKTTLVAVLTLPVVLIVYLMIRRIHHSMDHD